MFKKSILCLLLFLLICSAALAQKTGKNLYRARIDSQASVNILNEAGVEAVVRLSDGYLVLADEETAQQLTGRNMDVELIDADVTLERLALDNRRDRQNVDRYRLIFEEDDLRLYKLDFPGQAATERGGGLIQVRSVIPEMVYKSPVRIDADGLLATIDLDTILNRVLQDTVENYMHRLEAFNGRLTGTDSCYAASNWIKSKFESYGYTNVSFFQFYGMQLWEYETVLSRNVVAVKPGTVYPNQQIVIGGHYDAVPSSPGSDDNGTGTVGVMEIARALKDIETERTFIFIAFDSEESGLVGADEYAYDAWLHGDSIMLMLNMDMIAHYTNNSMANLYYGSEQAYSLLWSALAQQYAGITGYLAGQSSHSDHYPFIRYGYDAVFVQEYDFSTVYHTYQDSTTYCNFEYMTRMVKATLATALTVDRALTPITTVDVVDAGDGSSLQISWLPGDPALTDNYRIHYNTVPETQKDSIWVDKNSTSAMVTDLTEGQRYSFYVIAENDDGRSSIQYNEVLGTPYSQPALPEDQLALPLVGQIELSWAGNNNELDFDRYAVIRDNVLLPDIIYDTFFVDDDPALGDAIHDYLVVAVDNEDNISDTTGAEHLQMKAATLQESRVLVINRTSYLYALVDASISGEFLTEAMSGYYYDYLSDTAYLKYAYNVDLIDFVDYEVVVIAAESGAGYDDIGQLPQGGGILQDLGYYLQIGGKVIVFGRWGDISIDGPRTQTIYYPQGDHNQAYVDYFHIDSRMQPMSDLDVGTFDIVSDFVGCHSQMAGYPNLVWDQTLTTAHTDPFHPLTGIPCPSIPLFNSGVVDVIYTYDSYSDSTLTEGRPIAWRYIGGPYEYYYFDIPLSFMERTNAVTVIRKALSDLGIETFADADSDGIPDFVDNCINDYNPDQLDNDIDGEGDVCDDDDDDDSVADVSDNCPFEPNFDQLDDDLDGFGNACDVCPGYDDNVDVDGDGAPDGCDNCPALANEGQENSDGDSWGDACDNCRYVDNEDQSNIDGDDYGDLCDNCDSVANNNQADSDFDGRGNLCDNCMYDYNPGQEDYNGDGIGDACCCVGTTGNTNCSEQEAPDISDITRLIDYLYLSHAVLCCPGEADVNGSGGEPDISDITRLIDYLYLSHAVLPDCP